MTDAIRGISLNVKIRGYFFSPVHCTVDLLIQAGPRIEASDRHSYCNRYRMPEDISISGEIQPCTKEPSYDGRLVNDASSFQVSIHAAFVAH